MSTGFWLSRSVAAFSQGQDASTQGMKRFPSSIIECAGVQGIDQGQQLAAVGWCSCVLAAMKAGLNLGHGPAVVGGISYLSSCHPKEFLLPELERFQTWLHCPLPCRSTG
jgi:hypothetical protein